MDLPRQAGHEQRDDAHETRQGDEHAARIGPHVHVEVDERLQLRIAHAADGGDLPADPLRLQSGVDDEPGVEGAGDGDLDGGAPAQPVVHEGEGVERREDEERDVRWDDPRGWILGGVGPEVGFPFDEDEAVRLGLSDGGLGWYSEGGRESLLAYLSTAVTAMACKMVMIKKARVDGDRGQWVGFVFEESYMLPTRCMAVRA